MPLNPIAFEGHNVVLGKDQEAYQNLPALYNQQEGSMLTCWELTVEDIEKLKESKKIWISQYTFGHPFQPVLVCADQAEVFTLKPEEDGRN